VKLSTLLEIIGSGSILLVVGIGILLLGVGIGASEGLHIPLWATFCGLGLMTAIVGFTIVDRGSDEAEAQVAKKMPLLMNVIRSPYLTVGGSILGGILLQRLLRNRQEVVIANIGPSAPVDAAQSSPDRTQHAGAASADEGFSISQYLGDQMRSLATVATGAAVALGMEALGVPSVEQLIKDLLSGEKQTEKPADETAASPDDHLLPDDDYENTYPRAKSMQSSHNGKGVRTPEQFI